MRDVRPTAPTTDAFAAAAVPPAGLRCLLNALQCGAAILDRAGRFIHVNDRLCAMLDRPPDQIIHHALFELYPPKDRPWLERAIARSDRAWEDEYYLPPTAGQGDDADEKLSRQVIIGVRPLELEGAAGRYVVMTVIDVSPLKEAYSDVSKLTDTVLAQALDLKRYSQKLEQRVAGRTAELHEANMEAITMLAIASEARDSDTGEHVHRIKHAAQLLALQIGLGEAEAQRIGYSAILHDVGKMHIPDDILKKPGELTAAERTVMQSHTTVGESILSTKPFFETARLIARAHHENWDGSGYPDGLRGEAIPLPARIVHVVDVFDALSHHRVYKRAWPVERSAATVIKAAGSQFDPKLVEAFGKLYRAGALGK